MLYLNAAQTTMRRMTMSKYLLLFNKQNFLANTSNVSFFLNNPFGNSVWLPPSITSVLDKWVKLSIGHAEFYMACAFP